MKTKQFLDLVLGQQGNYCVFAANAAANRRKQKFYTSTEHVLDAAREFDQNGYDAYFSLACLTEAGSRKADNVHTLKSFSWTWTVGKGITSFLHRLQPSNNSRIFVGSMDCRALH